MRPTRPRNMKTSAWQTQMIWLCNILSRFFKFDEILNNWEGSLYWILVIFEFKMVHAKKWFCSGQNVVPSSQISDLGVHSLLMMSFAISQIKDGRHERFSKFYKNRHFLTLFTYLWDPQDQEIWKLVLGRLKWYDYATFHCVLWNLTKYSMIERGHLIESWWFWVQDETCEKLTL